MHALSSSIHCRSYSWWGMEPATGLFFYLPPTPARSCPDQVDYIWRENCTHTRETGQPSSDSHPTLPDLAMVILSSTSHNFLMSGQEAKYPPYLSRSASKSSLIIHSPWKAYRNLTMANILEKASKLLAPGTHCQFPDQDQRWWQIECWNKTKTTMDYTLLEAT